MARATEPLHGVARVGYVYTPPELRSRGYASSCVAAVSAEVLGQGASECMLYTELSNPSSNAIYRSIGYEAVSEVVSYRFG